MPVALCRRANASFITKYKAECGLSQRCSFQASACWWSFGPSGSTTSFWYHDRRTKSGRAGGDGELGVARVPLVVGARIAEVEHLEVRPRSVGALLQPVGHAFGLEDALSIDEGVADHRDPIDLGRSGRGEVALAKA